jgi:LytS/YehU family sensor histidine kinase
LVENCFKHGLKEGNGKDFIKIRIEISGAVLNFETENNKGPVHPSGLPEANGIGIGNVRKRLSLDYPNTHLLKIADNGKVFKILLQLQLT